MKTPNRNAPPPEAVRFSPADPQGPGVETISLAQLRQRGSVAHLAAVQRMEFLTFVLYSRGKGEHVVDFMTHAVGPGVLIVVQPGNVHQFRLNASMDARLLLVDPAFMLPRRLAYLKPLLGSAPWPARTQLDATVCAELQEICERLDADGRRKAAPALREALARQRLYTWLLLRIAWDATPGKSASTAAASPLAIEFRNLLEQHFMQRWTVLDYARRLGYAERTLTRACQADGGQSAKSLIDARVLLEAKRLLAYGTDSVDAISLRLGFNDSSSMGQFFKRLEGRTPMEFRRAVRSRVG